MESIHDLPFVLSFIIVLLAVTLLFSLVLGLIAAGIASFRERKRLLTAKAKTAASYAADGIIMDAQLIQEPPTVTNPLHYKYSIRYQDTAGTLHRALIGISSNHPLNYCAGEAIRLHLFQQSVIVPDAYAFNPNRSSSGIIDCLISFRKWLDKPIDETGTVMLEKDYLELSAELEQKIASRQRMGWIWMICGGLVFTASIIITLDLTLL